MPFSGCHCPQHALAKVSIGGGLRYLERSPCTITFCRVVGSTARMLCQPVILRGSITSGCPSVRNTLIHEACPKKPPIHVPSRATATRFDPRSHSRTFSTSEPDREFIHVAATQLPSPLT